MVFIEILFISTFCAMFVGAVIHIACLKKDRSAQRRLKVFLIWVLAFAGIIGLEKFYGNVFHPELYAEFLGWKPNDAWQYEVSVINFIIAALGILSIWFHDLFWLATVIALTIRDWGIAVGHYLELIRHYDTAWGNVGLAVYIEIFHPIVAIALLIAYYNVKKFPRKV
ncbi:DUF6790 family protein [Simkania sp.]|uniref:DUF6790 family protein n=1 Tax=Simkania sp. TaxID=34094 RepID=UPI003B51D2A1